MKCFLVSTLLVSLTIIGGLFWWIFFTESPSLGHCGIHVESHTCTLKDIVSRGGWKPLLAYDCKNAGEVVSKTFKECEFFHMHSSFAGQAAFCCKSRNVCCDWFSKFKEDGEFHWFMFTDFASFFYFFCLTLSTFFCFFCFFVAIKQAKFLKLNTDEI